MSGLKISGLIPQAVHRSSVKRVHGGQVLRETVVLALMNERHSDRRLGTASVEIFLALELQCKK